MHPHNEAGRRLLAAVMSTQMRIGMDYCLSRYVPEIVDPSWSDLAWQLQQHMVDQRAERLLNGIKGTGHTQ